MSRLSYFYIVAGIAAVIFALGVGGNVAFWLSSRERGRSPGYYLARFLRLFFSRRGLRLFFYQVLAQGHLFRESRLRWAMSVALAWGALELFFVGSLGDMAHEYGLSFLPKDTPWFAFANDLGGSLLFLGVALAALRRYILREPQLPSGWDDGLVLAWLAAAAISGYVAEAARLLAQGVAPDLAANSFIGYALALGLKPLSRSWPSIEPYLWWLHVGFALTLLAYLPYSKLFHIFTGPISLVAKARYPARKEDYVLP